MVVPGFILFTAACLAQEQPPAGTESRRVEDAIARCVELLLERQENLDVHEGEGPVSEGDPREWPYEGVYRVRGRGGNRIPLGYRIGGTAIAAWSLLEAPGWDDDERRRAAVERAVEFVLEGLEDSSMTPDFERGYDVRNWGHVYALQLLARMRELGRTPVDSVSRVDAAISHLVQCLVQNEIEGAGGWNYSRRGSPPSPSTFLTAPALQALFLAATQGEAVNSEVVDRGLRSLQEARLPTGAFQYATSERTTGEGFEAVPGAIGRMPVCETTLFLGGHGDPLHLRASLDAFFEHWEWLEKRRQQTGTHEPPYMIAPYYFFYAHFYAAQAIELLPERVRAEHRRRLLDHLFEVREEKGGGWNDRVFERSESFGTAMVLLALLRPIVPPPARWQPLR